MIVEDVVTTGGSSLQAIERAEAFGLKIVGVLAIIDRMEGGAEAFAQRGYPFASLLTIRDFGIEPPGELSMAQCDGKWPFSFLAVVEKLLDTASTRWPPRSAVAKEHVSRGTLHVNKSVSSISRHLEKSLRIVAWSD